MFEGVRSRSVTEIERVVLDIYTQNMRHGGGGGEGGGGGWRRHGMELPVN